RSASVLPSITGSSTTKQLAAAVGALRNDDNLSETSSTAWAAALALAVAVGFSAGSQEAECCGIMGVVTTGHSKDFDARALLLEGLSVLRNRGYDSAGMATADDTQLVVSKYASRGGKTDNNAHPHMDFGQRIALVHNGTINNAHDLRRDLEKKGIEFRSETDTEVIAHLVGMEMDNDPKCKVKEAVTKAVAKLDGTWGLAVIANERPDEIVVACNGSPMVIGLGTDHIFVASETAAFNGHTKNFIAMQDGEIAVINPQECSLDKARIELAPDHGVISDPSPHPHWTIYECLQQPMAIARALAFGGRMTEQSVVLGGPDRSKEKLKTIQNLLMTACGTSLFASMYGAKLMRDLGAVDTAFAVDAAELRTQDIPHNHGGMIAVSQSGETRDVLKALKSGETVGIPRMSVVNVVGSAIARETKVGVYLNAGRETAVASTKAFTTQVTVLSLLALWFRQLREETLQESHQQHAHDRKNHLLDYDMPHLLDKSRLMEALQRLPISFGMAMGVREKCQKVAQR
ncbi:unnamed protein product, partial [Discosporangium mesarthrocarpum]